MMLQQEQIVNTMQKKASNLTLERRALRREVRELRKQVQQYADDKARLGAEKVIREIELETEEVCNACIESSKNHLTCQ